MGDAAVQKKTLAILLIAALCLPLGIYTLSCAARSCLPPKMLPSYKTPEQFEAAFNEQMASYGMSIDLISISYDYEVGDSYARKVVPVQCADGGDITCRVAVTSKGSKLLLMYVEFEQPYDGALPANLQPLFEMLLHVFEEPLLDPTAEFMDGTYVHILDKYLAFSITEEPDLVIPVSSCWEQTDTIFVERTEGRNEEQGVLLLGINILGQRKRD